MMLVIQTQVYENYGDAIQPYWKPKGGQSIKVTDIPMGLSRDAMDQLAMTFEQATDYYTESVISWSIEADDYLSWFEQSQLEYDGVVQYPEPTVDYADAVNSLMEEV